jgi:peroxiredoxin family protein
MTTATVERPVDRRFDPLAEAIADVEGRTEPSPEPAIEPATRTKSLVIVNWSGDLDKIWPTLILSSTAAASGLRCRVFVTFWGLLPFVKDQKRIVGDNWMQKMLTLMQRPGIDHLKLSKMNFLGMGPWMMGRLARQQRNPSPAELLAIAQDMGVEFIPCQMTMDMFGLTRDDLIDGMGDPVGAATVIGLMSEGSSPLFI